MRSPITKYAILALGILLVLSLTEISTEEYQQSHNTECHFFVGTESIAAAVGTVAVQLLSIEFSLSVNPPATGPFNDFHRYSEIIGRSDSHPTRQDTPLYLDISTLRI